MPREMSGAITAFLKGINAISRGWNAQGKGIGRGEPSAAPSLKVAAIKGCWCLSDPALGALEGEDLDPGAGSEHPHTGLCLGAQQRPQE